MNEKGLDRTLTNILCNRHPFVVSGGRPSGKELVIGPIRGRHAGNNHTSHCGSLAHTGY
jgi:hypothetical protein